MFLFNETCKNENILPRSNDTYILYICHNIYQNDIYCDKYKSLGFRPGVFHRGANVRGALHSEPFFAHDQGRQLFHCSVATCVWHVLMVSPWAYECRCPTGAVS